MSKLFLLFIFCFWMITSINAQKKSWRATVFTNDSKDKGVLKGVNDSSLVLLTKSSEQTVLFKDISRLKFIRKITLRLRQLPEALWVLLLEPR